MKNMKKSIPTVACVMALTMSILSASLSVEAAGQLVGGFNPGNEATGEGSVIVGGGDTGVPNKTEGKNSTILGGTRNAKIARSSEAQEMQQRVHILLL